MNIPVVAEKTILIVNPPLMAFTVAVTVSDEAHRGKRLRAPDTSDDEDNPLKRSAKENQQVLK